MNLFTDNGEVVAIYLWKHKDGDGEFRPLQTYDAIEEFGIKMNNEKVAVYFNKSKSSIDYYYLNLNDLWHWTKDEKIKNCKEYKT